jgi:hypothetical protein
MEPKYLGDGVYVLVTDCGVLLTTGHHDPQWADNIIHLEPPVAEALMKYLKQVFGGVANG